MIHERSTGGKGLALAALVFWSCAIDTMTFAGSLYRCESSDHRMIYTDTPAQFDRCVPVSFSQPHMTVQASPAVAGGPSTPSLIPQNPAPAPPIEASSDPVIGPGTNGIPPASATEPTCQPGINPLNPLSAPPCPQ